IALIGIGDLETIKNFGNQRTDLLEFRNAETAGRTCRRAEADAGGHKRLFRVKRNTVLVAGDVGAAKSSLCPLAGRILRTQIDQHKMVIGAARNDVEAIRLQFFSQRARVVDYVLGIELEFWLQRFSKGNSLTGDDVHQRTTLKTREHSRIDLLGDVGVVGEDHAAARTAKRLVRRRRADMRMRNR